MMRQLHRPWPQDVASSQATRNRLILGITKQQHRRSLWYCLMLDDEAQTAVVHGGRHEPLRWMDGAPDQRPLTNRVTLHHAVNGYIALRQP